jgi:hypothetical protein
MKYGIYTLVIENYLVKHLSLFRLYPSMLEFGWGNGYILLPTNHPLYKKPYDDINDIRVHGGLTYGQLFNSDSFLKWIDGLSIDGDVTLDNYEKFNNYWMIGFDTSHYGDNKENCNKEYVIRQSEYLIDQCLDDKIEGVKKYKYRCSMKEKLININNIIE